MPISSISTIFIHNHAPVLENATILKNAYKQHFAGVSDQNRNHSYYDRQVYTCKLKIQFLPQESIVQNLICSTLRITHIAFFSKHNFPHYSKSHLLPFPISLQLSIFYQLLSYSIQLYRYYNTVTTMQHIVTTIISITYSYIYRYNLSIKIYDNRYRYKHID